jgi:Fe-Mn family superoxide dismutase
VEGKSLEEIVKASFGKNAGLFNNAGQHYNHLHFWKWMKPNGGGKLPGEAREADHRDLGSVDKDEGRLHRRRYGQFGSGWSWLAVKDGKIVVTKTANGESPLVHGASPILGCDVWEHSYYIDYRNRRPDYLKAFVENLVNWEYVAEMFRRREPMIVLGVAGAPVVLLVQRAGDCARATLLTTNPARIATARMPFITCPLLA